MAARIAFVYDPSFFEEENARYVLLVPVFGGSVASQILWDLGKRGGEELTFLLIKKHISKQTLRTLKRVMLKHFGMRIAQRGIIAKTVPIVGGAIGAGWNLQETRVIARRVVQFFDLESRQHGMSLC